jgi:hypothetical protein
VLPEELVLVAPMGSGSPCEADRPVRDRLAEPGGVEVRTGRFDGERLLRQQGDACSTRHDLDEGGEAAGPEVVLGLRAGVPADAERLVAETVPVVEEQHGLVLEVALPDAPSAPRR